MTWGSVLFFSCHPAKKVPSGSYLLDKNVITVNTKEITKSELSPYLKQLPNRRLIGFRFGLWLYNRSKDNKNNFVHRWLRTAGEPPVVYDESLQKRSSQQMQLYLQNRGYYNAVVIDTMIPKGQKAIVYYTVLPGTPYHIRSVSYVFEDSLIAPYVLADTGNCLLHPGDLFDLNRLQEERSRIESLLKTKGFYNFNKEYVFFQADSNLGMHQVDLTLGIAKYVWRDTLNKVHSLPHRRYFIEHVYVMTEYRVSSSDSAAVQFDTIKAGDVYFLCSGKPRHDLRIIRQNILIQPGQLFNMDQVTETYKKLSLLRNFKFIDIVFREKVFKENNHADMKEELYPLDCYIRLIPYAAQSYQAEIEGTNNNGNFGAGVNLIYQHKNLFHKAQILDIKLRGGYETLRNRDKTRIYNTFEYGAEVRLSIPQFLLPFSHEEFVKKYSPKTTLLAAYNFRERPDYSRTLANLSFGYNWKGNPFTTYTVNLVEINYVFPQFKDAAFEQLISQSFLKYSYQKQFITSVSMGYLFTNQEPGKNITSYYFNIRGESAGVLLRGYSNLVNLQKNEKGLYQLFGTDYAQYVKMDIEVKYYQPVNVSDRLAYRFYAGVGVPYKNSVSMPFVRRYFCGGAYSIRGWQPRAIGPGSSVDTSGIAFPMQTGDMKLEGNVEYRFRLFGSLEGAMFIDAGNIWNIKENDPAGSIFNPFSFYRQIAIGSGAGLRYDFSFFVLRFDVGMKTRDPSAPDGHHWPLFNGHFTARNDVNFFIAIGYPF